MIEHQTTGVQLHGWHKAFHEHANVHSHLRELLSVLFEPAVELLERTVKEKGTIYLCGNGGSAAHAQHMAAELVVRYRTDRAPIAAIALTTDPSVMSACANDMAWNAVFARQVAALGKAGDSLVVFSTSGKSPNVLEAVHTARAHGLRTLALTGMKGLAGSADVDLNVPSIATDRIQEMHTLLVHLLVEELERRVLL